ncbi:MAG TPA: DUF2892 domain-containing protein [Bradyrhizobium sp.]|uniref:YgaP family membrane protein n=1 Tax=Bradyrhizobium sp. TaxID=376 RepID=UPI002BBC9B59|nr:DUF2892 domain-containing protein [Bradyrhizobium sp.]HLZ01159.1 DUF2892 domain-containing protein [Bradyrhizobium sp.]
MTRNVGRIDQFVRIVIGLALLAYTVKDGSLGSDWLVPGVVGLVLIITAFFSYCPLYAIIGVTTCGKTDRTA